MLSRSNDRLIHLVRVTIAFSLGPAADCRHAHGAKLAHHDGDESDGSVFGDFVQCGSERD